MKEKQKLTLKKEIITKLDSDQQLEIKGGSLPVLSRACGPICGPTLGSYPPTK